MAVGVVTNEVLSLPEPSGPERWLTGSRPTDSSC